MLVRRGDCSSHRLDGVCRPGADDWALHVLPTAPSWPSSRRRRRGGSGKIKGLWQTRWCRA